MSRVIGYLTADQKGRTTLPQAMRKQLGLAPGVQLRVEQADNGAVELVPAVSIPHDQLFYHSTEGRARLEQAEEDIRQAHVTRTTGLEEARVFLDSLKASARARRSSTR